MLHKRGPFEFYKTSQALKTAVCILEVSYFDYSHANDERQLECAYEKSFVDRPFVRHSVERDRGARSLAELYRHLLLTIDDFGAALLWVMIIDACPLYP